MSGKYKVGEDAIPHFVTFTVVGWIDVFSREQYKELFVESLKYCQENKGLELHAWVIMTNHVHLIMSSNTNKIEHIVRDVKKYTGKQIIKAHGYDERPGGPSSQADGEDRSTDQHDRRQPRDTREPRQAVG